MPRPWTAALALVGLLSCAARADEPVDDRYEALLARYVDGEGMVDYAAFKAQDEAALRAVVADLARLDPGGMPPPARKAYWINVYNAVTLQAMLEFFPLESIQLKVSREPGGYSVWKDYRFGPRKVSLDQIEGELRSLGDPRIHAALVCASRGCPILRAEAYRPERLDEQLDEQVRRWLRDERRGLRFDGESTVLLSSIFDWYAKDFAPDEAGRLRWIARYVEPPVAERLLKGGLAVGFLSWDWTLNRQEGK